MDIERSGGTKRAFTVSVVIVNYNARHLLESCVALSLEQAEDIIVVDNASTDGSLETLYHRFGKNPCLKIVRNSSNLGFAAACNIGANLAAGRFALFLNPDCELEEGAVDQLALALEANPQAGMAGGLLLDKYGKEQAGGRRAVPTPWRSLVRIFHLSRLSNHWPRLFADFNLHKQPLPDKPVELEAISGACMMLKHSSMRDVGPWDENYFLHCEDLDLCMRYRRRGWSILFVPAARIIHHRGACSRSRPVFVEWHKHHGMLRFYRKFFRHQYPGGLMWLVTFGVWARFCAVIAYIGMRGIGRKFIDERNG
jgi:GT2 family glycosyltransferase